MENQEDARSPEGQREQEREQRRQAKEERREAILRRRERENQERQEAMQERREQEAAEREIARQRQIGIRWLAFRAGFYGTLGVAVASLIIGIVVGIFWLLV